jgi:hypothetical protein
MGTRTAAARVLATALLLVGATACTELGELVEASSPAPASGRPPAGLPSPTDAAAQLARLPVVARTDPGLPAYTRDAFGSSWADVDGNGCNQRDDVLLRDAVPGSTAVARQGRCPHDVLAGTWVDPYTGDMLEFDDLKDLSQAQAIQIDHVVPLAEAWVSGAWEWPPARRLRFANDLDGLLAVDGPTNASKGADDPAAWRPRKAYQCSYALRWIHVKHRWGLGVDASEAAALADLLGACA